MGDIFHPDRGKIQNLGIFCHQLPGHKGYVICGGIMVGGLRQSAAVLKMSSCHVKSCCPLIHTFDKLRFASGYMFRHGDAGIISGGNDNTLDHGLHCLLLALLQIDLGTAHGLSVGTCGHFILHM